MLEMSSSTGMGGFISSSADVDARRAGEGPTVRVPRTRAVPMELRPDRVVARVATWYPPCPVVVARANDMPRSVKLPSLGGTDAARLLLCALRMLHANAPRESHHMKAFLRDYGLGVALAVLFVVVWVTVG